MTKTKILAKYAPRMENVLLILHDFQNNNPRNYLPEKDLALIADYLNTTRGSIYGIASYYSMFSLEPRGKHIIRICRSPVCQMIGVSDLLTELYRILRIDIDQTTADGLFTLETTECLGHCERAPAMSIDDTVYGRLTARKIQTVLQQFRPKALRAGSTKK